jgi:predicted nucleotidyltransferase
MRREELLRTLREGRAVWEPFGVAQLWVFGSVARDEATEWSDIDLLVEFDRPIGLIDFIRLRDALQALIGRPVDLVTPAALKRQLRDQIRSEAVRAA